MPAQPIKWRRFCRPDDEEKWEALLWEEVPGQWSIVADSKRRRLCIEVVFPRRAAAELWQSRHGGVLEELPPEVEWSRTPSPTPPVRIRDRLLVTSERDPRELDALRREHPGRRLLIIPAELAFGTGTHPTTRTCLRLLCDFAEQRVAEGEPWSLLDLGTGTGVLSVAAILLGATSSLGSDFEPRAAEVFHRNARRNGVEDRVEFRSGDVRELSRDWFADGPPKERGWPIVAANLFHDVLLPLFPRLPAVLAPGATVLWSGVLREQEDNVVQAAAAAGFETETVVRVGKWCTGRARWTSPTPSCPD